MINQRERILMVIVAGIVGTYGIFFLIQRALLGPLGTQAEQIRNLKNDIAAKNKQFEKTVQASDRVAEWKEASVPSDEATARSMYQEFLIKLMRDCHVQDAVLIPIKTQRVSLAPSKNQRTKAATAVNFTRIPFKVSGKVTVENLTELLYRFYQPNLLHQIRGARITRTKDGKMLDVELSVEALALDAVSDREQLVPESGESRNPLLAGAPREAFSIISKKNIFEPFREEPKVEPKKDPEIDPAKHVLLTGYIHVGNEPEAWLYNRLTNEQKVLRPGDELDLAGVKGKLERVTAAGIVLEIDAQQWMLALGRNLREMRSLGSTAAVTGAQSGGQADTVGPGDGAPANAPRVNGTEPDSNPDNKPKAIPEGTTGESDRPPSAPADASESKAAQASESPSSSDAAEDRASDSGDPQPGS